jgi:hypothetical protein
MVQNLIYHLELHLFLDLLDNLTARLLSVDQADYEVGVSVVQITKI